MMRDIVKNKKTAIVLLMVLIFTQTVFSQTTEDIRQVIDRAVSELLKAQESDGTWAYEGVYRVGGEIPVGYRIGGTAIVCQMLLYVDTKHKEEVETAFSKGLDYILKDLEHPLMKPSTVDAYDVRVWGHACALELFCRIRAADYAVSQQQKKAIDAWIKKLVNTLVTEELPSGGWNYSNRRQHASFVTAPVTQTIMWALSQEEKIPEEVLMRARDALLEARYSSGAFEYAGSKRNPGSDGESILPGLIARSAVCESTLFLLGSGSVDAIKNALDSFHKYWIELEKRRQKPGTHEPPYGVAPYYFFFGHYYAGQAVELLPERFRQGERERLEKVILQVRDEDGTWNDRVFRRSSGFGTAMAVMTLISNKIPSPPAYELKNDN